MIRYTLFAVMVVVFLSYVSGQTDLAHSYTPDKQPLNETALFVADALYKHPVLFRKLLKIGAAAKPLLKLGGNDPKLGMFWNFVLDMLPGLLQSPETASILEILADELHRVNITDVYGFLQAHNMTQDNPQAKQMVSGAIWKRFDKLRTVRRILTGNSARHFLPMTSNDTITDVCYNDMMNFMDAMISAQIPPRDALNYTFIPWALNMLDSYGKPPSGIFEGNVHWLGEPKECRSIHAQLAPGVILGNKTLTSPIDFKGKYCRAVFHHLPLVADISQMDDTVTWGVCVPDTCSEQDVEEMFQLGFMKNFQTTPDNVSCSDIQEPTGHVPVTPRTPTTGPPTRPSVAANSLFTSCSDCKDRIKPDEWMNCFFSSFDTDKNGNISKREWWSESHKLGLDTTDQGQIARAFIQLDINKDLQIDAPDLKYLFAFSDDNGDGFVNLQEFSYNWQSVVS
ncbi:uncharacterized protein LOC124129262 isoform X2 [Haliotis rufescens]|uniref:uncharacterized protein LOC124129262 isoform X2 n=1 Tax=Haliotis rufescens TaxID=6454 RepID=UPI00201EBDD8|nr:uncharacterized protein LOC124129262 isoform X2 [Haliotis rufescens]